jgi:hypothetical protein
VAIVHHGDSRFARSAGKVMGNGKAERDLVRLSSFEGAGLWKRAFRNGHLELEERVVTRWDVMLKQMNMRERLPGEDNFDGLKGEIALGADGHSPRDS